MNDQSSGAFDGEGAAEPGDGFGVTEINVAAGIKAVVKIGHDGTAG